MVLTSKLLNIAMKTLEPCNHTEADTRTCIFLHLAHAAYQGHEKACVRPVDSDSAVLALSLFENAGLAKIWIGFVSGKSYRAIFVHFPHQQLHRWPIKVISVAIDCFTPQQVVIQHGMYGKVLLTLIALTNGKCAYGAH